MSKLSRDKGKRYERAIARRYRALFGDRVRRGWQSRQGDDDPDIVGAGPFAPECKHQRRPNVRAAVEQATENAKPGQVPVAHVRWHGGFDVVVLLAEDWWDLIEEWKERGE